MCIRDRKNSERNDEIDRLRHSATCALFERRDVIIVASVSCIYGLGDPEDYTSLVVSLRPGMEIGRDQIIRRLIDIQYTRNDMNLIRGTFRVRGDTIEVIPSWSEETVIRIELFGDEVERLSEVHFVTGNRLRELNHVMILSLIHISAARAPCSAGRRPLRPEAPIRRRRSAEASPPAFSSPLRGRFLRLSASLPRMISPFIVSPAGPERRRSGFFHTAVLSHRSSPRAPPASSSSTQAVNRSA